MGKVRKLMKRSEYGWEKSSIWKKKSRFWQKIMEILEMKNSLNHQTKTFSENITNELDQTGKKIIGAGEQSWHNAPFKHQERKMNNRWVWPQLLTTLGQDEEIKSKNSWRRRSCDKNWRCKNSIQQNHSRKVPNSKATNRHSSPREIQMLAHREELLCYVI